MPLSVIFQYSRGLSRRWLGPRVLTRSKVTSSSTDNWFPAAYIMLERSNVYRAYFLHINVTYTLIQLLQCTPIQQ
jgi:hypothetical protein